MYLYNPVHRRETTREADIQDFAGAIEFDSVIYGRNVIRQINRRIDGGKQREKNTPPVLDLSIETERLRLGDVGFRSYFKIAQSWDLTDQESLDLLALKSSMPLEQLSHNPAPELFTEERMLRISYLIGIYKGLHICYGQDLANGWIKLRNRNPLFGGTSPLEYMIRGGLDSMHQVRKLIDARSAGN